MNMANISHFTFMFLWGNSGLLCHLDNVFRLSCLSCYLFDIDCDYFRIKMSRNLRRRNWILQMKVHANMINISYMIGKQGLHSDIMWYSAIMSFWLAHISLCPNHIDITPQYLGVSECSSRFLCVRYLRNMTKKKINKKIVVYRKPWYVKKTVVYYRYPILLF